MNLREPTDYPHIFKNTTIYIIWKLLFVVLMVGATLYTYKEGNLLATLMIGVLTFLLLLFNIHLLKDEPIIKISNQGIWTKHLGFTKWKDIHNIEIEDKNIFKYLSKRASESMFIYLDKNEKLPSETVNILGVENKELLRSLVYKHMISKNYVEERDESNTSSYISYKTRELKQDLECVRRIQKINKSIIYIVFIEIVLALLIPLLDKEFGFFTKGLIESYGYYNSVLYSGLGIFSLAFVVYLLMIFICQKRKESRNNFL